MYARLYCDAQYAVVCDFGREKSAGRVRFNDGGYLPHIHFDEISEDIRAATVGRVTPFDNRISRDMSTLGT